MKLPPYDSDRLGDGFDMGKGDVIVGTCNDCGKYVVKGAGLASHGACECYDGVALKDRIPTEWNMTGDPR